MLISDFYEDPDDVLRALAHLRGRGNDLIVFHLLDPREIDFSFSDASNFIDMETGTKMPVIPEYLRKQYRELMRAAHAALSKRIGESRADYALFDTSKPLDRALFAYLGVAAALQSGAIDEFPRARVPRRHRGDRHSGDHPPDQPRAEGRRRVSVADVPAAHSVSLGAAAEAAPPAVAPASLRGARAARRGVRAAVLREAASGDHDDRRARSRRPARPLGEHGLRRPVVEGARRREEGRAADSRRRSRDARLFAGDASVASEPMATPRSDRGRDQRREAELRRNELRAGAQARVADHFGVHACRAARWSSSPISRRSAGRTTTRSRFRAARRHAVDVGGASAADVAVSQVTTDRDSTGERDHVTVAARLDQHRCGTQAVSATLAVGGRDVQTQHVDRSGARRAAGGVHVDRRAEAARPRARSHHAGFVDARRRLNFTIAPDASVPVLVVEPANPRANQSLFLSRALSIGDRPSFRVDEKAIDALTPRDFDGRALVVLDEVDPPARRRRRATARDDRRRRRHRVRSRQQPAGDVGQRLARDAAGDDRQVVDRTADAGGTLSSIDYAHPVFELFNAPRSGDFSTARFYRYRALTPSPARACRRASTTVRRRSSSAPWEAGSVLIWASTLRSVLDEPSAAAGVPAVRAPTRQARRPLRRSAALVHGGRSARPVATWRAHRAVLRLDAPPTA